MKQAWISLFTTIVKGNKNNSIKVDPKTENTHNPFRILLYCNKLGANYIKSIFAQSIALVIFIIDNCFKMTLNRMEKIKLISDICLAVFGLLAALCAVLSLIYGSKIDVFKKIEEERLKTRIAESNAVAEQANKDAANATERAKQLDLKVEEQKEIAAKLNILAEKAKEEAAKAIESAASTNEHAKQLELKVAEQKERAANAEKELIILKQKVRSRSFTHEVWMKLMNELHEFPPQAILISSSLGDGEAANYADQFKRIFQGAGWKVSSSVGSSGLTGVGISVFTKNPIDPEADKLIQLLHLNGVEAKRKSMEKQVMIQLFIGSKINADKDPQFE